MKAYEYCNSQGQSTAVDTRWQRIIFMNHKYRKNVLDLWAGVGYLCEVKCQLASGSWAETLFHTKHLPEQFRFIYKIPQKLFHNWNL